MGAVENGHLVIMGVAGSGKSTLARLLAERLNWPFAEGDDFHQPSSIRKMAAGQPLADDDRWPWLAGIRDWLRARAEAGERAVVACSALRAAHRDILREAGPIRFVHLVASPEVIARRLAGRSGHFMPAALLASQLAVLEPLDSDETGCQLAADRSPEELADQVLRETGTQ